MTHNQETNFNKTAVFAFALVAAVAFAIVPDSALAGTGGASFDPVWTCLLYTSPSPRD